MPSSPDWMNPLLGRLPGVISLAMLFDFLRCLPRPRLGGPVGYGRQMIADALAAIDAIGPRDKVEAALVMQIPTLLLAARETEAAARAEPDLDRRMRIERHMSMLQRRAEGLSAEVRRHRKELVTGLNLRHVSPPALEYDLDMLEAVWRDLERELPESALVAVPMEYPAGWEPPAAGEAGVVELAEVTVAAPVEIHVERGPDGWLEDRDEFEVPPQPVFQGIPKWKQAGRKYLDELPDDELAELVAAQKRGELIEEPPHRPEAWSES